jgi:hypothetical protein
LVYPKGVIGTYRNYLLMGVSKTFRGFNPGCHGIVERHSLHVALAITAEVVEMLDSRESPFLNDPADAIFELGMNDLATLAFGRSVSDEPGWFRCVCRKLLQDLHVFG